MKKNDLLLILSAFTFSILFYQQMPGLNFLLFTILLSTLTAFYNPGVIKQSAWWYYAALMIICGLSVFICNSDLSILATVFSFLVFSGKSYNTKNSIVINAVFSLYSLISTPVYLILDLNKRREQGHTFINSRKQKLYLGVASALVISVLFFALYQQANPLFKDFTHKIDLSWVSIGWCFFTVFGFIVIYGLLFHRNAKGLSAWDIEANRTIAGDESRENKELSGIGIVALVLFALLNFMLLFVNILDVNNLFFSSVLPEGVTLSDFVHNAVWPLVFSILIAVGLIIWFFKNELNFVKQSGKIKLLVYLWIIQSGIMISSAIVRNSRYIEGYQLSYLRIGVYVFLGLSLVGLFFTFLKIYKAKTGWFLVRQNFEAWFLILALCSLVNWDRLITFYNVSHAKSYATLDKSYLVFLSAAALPEMSELMFNHPSDSMKKDTGFIRLSSQLYNFMLKKKDFTWQSFNLRDQSVIEKLQLQLNEKGINQLALTSEYDVKLRDMGDFFYLRSLIFKNAPVDYECFAFFKNLESLSFEVFNTNYLKWLVLNKELRTLKVIQELYGNQSVAPLLNRLKKLEKLNLPSISNEDLLKLNNHPSLKLLTLKYLYQDQIGFIKQHNLSFKVEEVKDAY